MKKILKNATRILSDKAFISLRYRMRFGKFPNLTDPKTFNEKLQWLKLNDRSPEYSTMVDKFEVKKYVSSKIGSEYIIPTLGVWDKFEDIDFSSLPDKFVLKCTHDSGGLSICNDKSSFDYKSAKAKINRSLKTNYYYFGREWPYKAVKPRIIAEKFMQDECYENLPVYKFFCFHGEPKIIQTIQNDKQPSETIDYFDTDWNLLDLRQNYPNSETPLSKPQKLDCMLKLAKILSNDKNFIRVDLYVINDKIYFSEFTFFSDSGFAKFQPDYWDKALGDLIKLPTKKVP